MTRNLIFIQATQKEPPVDLQITRWLHQYAGQSGWLDHLLLGMARWGLPALGVLLAGAYLLGRPDRKAGKRGAVLAFLAATLALGLAHLSLAVFYRDRPFMDGPEIRNLLDVSPSSSFPSDHAVAQFAFAAALGAGHPLLRLVAWAIAVLTVIGRVYGGVHYPVDVLAGAAFGSAIGWVLWQIRLTLFPFLDLVCRWLDGAWRTLVLGRG